MIRNNVVNVPVIYSDRMYLSGLPIKLAEELRLRGLTLNSREDKVSFVGILTLDEKLYVFLPRSVQVDANVKPLEIASNTLKAVEKYGRESETRVDTLDEGDGRKSLKKLSLICDLLVDYRQNGIYTRRREIRKRNHGKTDWKRTVNRVIPFSGNSNQPVYIDSYGVKRQYFNNSEISLIHASVIHHLDVKYSWIVTGNLKVIAPELRDYAQPKGSALYQVAKLQNELNQTYSDRDIRLLKMLIRYLQELNGSDPSRFIAGLEKFHFCWEHMLGKVLKYVVDINRKLPAPAYIDKNENELTAYDKGMRTDIILHDTVANTYTIADAKYYAATGTFDAPGWSDIVKQLFYEKAVQTIDESALIKNAFIFPGTDGNLKMARIKNRLKSTKNNSVFVNGFKPVYCYYTDPSKVIDYYLKSKKMDDLTEQLLKIITD